MNKRNILALSVALAITGVAHANDNVDVYGKINVSLQANNEASGDNITELKSNASRFGLKGKSELNKNLSVFYKLEWEVDPTDNSKGSTDNIKSRNQIIGLKGDFGTFFVGRHDTPTKVLQKKVDLFNDYEGDMKHIINGDARKSNILQYSTPKLGENYSVNIAVVPGEDSASGNDGLADATSVTFTYDNSGLYLGIGFDSDIEGAGIDTTRFVSQYTKDAFQFGLIFESTESDAVNLDANGYVISGAYKSGNNTFKLQYADSDIWQLGVSSSLKYSTMTSIGMDHKLAKKTKFFVWYTDGELGINGENDSYFGLGLEHKF